MATNEENEESARRLLDLLQRQAEEEEKSAERRVAKLTSLKDEIGILENAAEANKNSVAQKKLLLEASLLEQQRQTEILQLRKDAALLDDQNIRNLLTQQGLLEGNADEIREILENDKTNLSVLDKKLQAQRRVLANRKKINQDARKLNSLTNELGQLADNAAEAFEGIRAGDIQAAGSALGAIGGQASKAGKSVQKTMGVSIPSAMALATQSFTELDNAIKDFNKNFGFGPEYTDRIRDTYDELRIFGVTAKEAGEAQAALIKGVSDFTLMAPEQRSMLTEQVAILNEIGVSAQTSAAIIQNSIKILGTNVDETDNVLRRLTANARELGFQQEEYMAAFATMGKDLAKLGSEGEMAFKKLAHASRITGMEMSRILTLTSAFDTFEGAATQAGKLNAALGGNFVNAMDLMMATDPAERFGMIRDSILDTGLAFDDMSYYQRLFYVDALGLSDVGELAQVLSGDFDNLSGSVMANEETLLQQREAAKAAKTVQESLNNAIAGNVTTITKIIENINRFGQALANNEELVKNVITGLIALKGFTMAVSVAQALATVTSLSMGASMAVATVGIGAMAYAFYQLKDGMDMHSPSLVVLQLALMVPIVQALGAALNSSVPGLLAFGAAMLLAGGGIYLAAAGMSLLVPKFTELFEVADPSQLLALGVSMAALVGSFVVMGSPIGLLAIAGIASLTAGLFTLSFALRKMPGPETMSGLSLFTSNLLTLVGVADKLSIVSDEIEKIGKAVESVPDEKTIRMTAMLDKMQSTMLAAAAAPINVTSNIIQAANNATTATTAATGPQVVVKQPIDIYLDKSKIGDFTMDIFADRVIGEIAKAR